MKTIKIQSISDIITNSSSEAFMLDSTKLSEKELSLFKAAIDNDIFGVSYVNDLIRECPEEFVEFTNLYDIPHDDYYNYEYNLPTHMVQAVEDVEAFLSKYNKNIDDASQYLVVFDTDQNEDIETYLNKCREMEGFYFLGQEEVQGTNQDAVIDHSFCFS